MSPARSGWRSSPSPTRSPRLSQAFTAAAICRASLTRGLVSDVVSNGSSHASMSSFSSGSTIGHSSTSPGDGGAHRFVLRSARDRRSDPGARPAA